MADYSLIFEVEGLDRLAEDLAKAERASPEICRKYITLAGRQFLKDVRKKTRDVTKKHTGNLLRGYRSKVVLQNGSLKAYEARINGGNGKAHHFHLVEDGHAGKVPDRSGQMHSIGRVEGRKMMDFTIKKWDGGRQIAAFAAAAMEEALKRGNLN